MPLSTGLVLRDGEVAVVADASPAEDPALLLRAAADAAYLGVAISRPTMRRFDAEAGSPSVPWSADVRDAFVALLGGGDAMVPQVELLDEHGLFVRYVPEWDGVRCKPQRNAFHRFTVDRHLLEAVARAGDVVRSVRRPDLLLVGAMLHDLGKGQPGDHTDNGVVLAQTVATRMGFDAADVTVLVDLVRHHLLLPSFAVGRDLEDPATIDAVADAVGRPRTRSTSWPRSPSPTRSRPVRPHGATGRPVCSRVSSTRCAPSCVAGGVSTRPSPPTTCATRTSTPSTAPSPSIPGPAGVTLVAPDALGLLAIEVAVLGVHAQSVRRARTFTVDGVAVGEFELEPERGREPDWNEGR